MSMELIHSEESVMKYVTFCEENSTDPVPGATQLHHILPRGVFPEYSDLKIHEWNGVNLSNDDHYIAHSLLHDAIEHISFASAWYAMNNKNYFRGEPLELIGSELYGTLIEKRNKQQSKNTAGKVICRSISNPERGTFKVPKSEFDNDPDLVGHTIGQGGERIRGTTTVIIDGKNTRITTEEYVTGNYKHIRSGMMRAKDINGKIFDVSTNDPRVLFGELVGFNQGRKFPGAGVKISRSRKLLGHGIGSKNPKARKINIYDSDDTLVHECHGNFDQTCKENNIPAQAMAKTYKDDSIYLGDFDNMSKGSKTRFTNNGLIQFKGWYARKIK